MITVLEYLVIAAVIGAVVFGIAVVVFGRGEQMAALPARTSPSELPATGIRGEHVRGVRFGLAMRGYRMSDVDWTLERLADEIDGLHARLAALTGDDGADPSDETATEDSAEGSDLVPAGASVAVASRGDDAGVAGRLARRVARARARDRATAPGDEPSDDGPVDPSSATGGDDGAQR